MVLIIHVIFGLPRMFLKTRIKYRVVILRVYLYVCNSWFRERTKALQLMAKKNRILFELNLCAHTFNGLLF
jgi:hypothetical protein